MKERTNLIIHSKRCLLLSILLVLNLLIYAQFTARFKLKEIPGNHPGDTIYVAGTFNEWKPAMPGTAFSLADSFHTLEISNLAAGEYRFKFTRGSWQKVETTTAGTDIGNRELRLQSDTTVEFDIAAWKDDFTKDQAEQTASANVSVIDTAFKIPQLNTTRRIWLYLPQGYKKGKKRYPVMYMHDGQNIFDASTSAYGEWGVDECLDSMIKKGRPACIVVGIDNGPNRMTEYNPYEFREMGKGRGDAYVDFIAKTLKPFIDKRYRTNPSSQHTIVAGSSMGGLISFYAMLKYPNIFGKAGIFSPAFWTAEAIQKLTESSGKQLKGKLFFYMGGQEGGSYIEDMNRVIEKLGRNSSAIIYSVVDPPSGHNEQAWRKWFPAYYNWIMAKGFNNVIRIDD